MSYQSKSAEKDQKTRQNRAAADHSSKPAQLQGEEEELQMKKAPAQLAAEEEELQMKSAVQLQGAEEEELQMKSATQLQAYKMPVQKKENKTGLPDNLKAGVENLSGYAMDDVKVHYNSSKPAQLEAHAYAQGTDIHVAPGQEKHLGHEAWHVAQQKQGRVKPTVQTNGVAVNDDKGLEQEADSMGAKALSYSAPSTAEAIQQKAIGDTAQLWPWSKKKEEGFALLDDSAEKSDEGEVEDPEAAEKVSKLKAVGDQLALYKAMHDNYRKYKDYIGSSAWNKFNKGWEIANKVIGWISNVDPTGISKIISKVSKAVREVTGYIKEAVDLSNEQLREEVTPLLPKSLSLADVKGAVSEALTLKNAIEAAVDALT